MAAASAAPSRSTASAIAAAPPLLGLTLLGAFDRGRVGQRRPAGPLALADSAGPARPAACAAAMVACRSASALNTAALRAASASCSVLYRAASAGLRTSVSSCRSLQFGVALGDPLLLGEDRLLPLGLGQRTGRRRPCLGGVDLGLHLGLLQRQVALADRDRLLGLHPLGLRGAPGLRLGDGRLLQYPRRLRPTEVLEVRAGGADVLELEGVQDQALVGQRPLGLLGHVRRRTRPGRG